MSSFRENKTKITHQDSLIAGLKELGYKPEVNETKVDVRGHGSERLKAEIVLRKEDIGQGGDIGFSKNADGTFSVKTDVYVMRNNFNLDTFTAKVATQYATTYGKALAKKNGYRLDKTITNSDGTFTHRFVTA